MSGLKKERTFYIFFSSYLNNAFSTLAKFKKSSTSERMYITENKKFWYLVLLVFILIVSRLITEPQ